MLGAKRKIIKYILLILSIIFVWFCVHIVYTVYEGNDDDTGPADVGVIFGAKLAKDGSISGILVHRVELGMNLYRDRKVKKLIVTGGGGKAGKRKGDSICEAWVMRDYLIEHGIPSSDIIVDDKAKNTEENVENTLKIKDSLKFKSIYIASHYYHIPRIEMLFHKKNFYNIKTAGTHIFGKRTHPMAIVREFFAYYYYLVFT